MYREDEFYFITDKLHHDIYQLALKDYIELEERVIVKIFSKANEEVIMEAVNGKDTIVKDTRKDTSTDITTFDLVFVKMMERYVSSYEIKNMYYEYINGLGAWYRVKIPGFNPNDKDLSIFYKKKKVTEDLIKNSDVRDDIKEKQLKFLKITKGLSFTKPSVVKNFFKR